MRWIINEKAVKADLVRHELLSRALVTRDADLVDRHNRQLKLVLDECSKVRVDRASVHVDRRKCAKLSRVTHGLRGNEK